MQRALAWARGGRVRACVRPTLASVVRMGGGEGKPNVPLGHGLGVEIHFGKETLEHVSQFASSFSPLFFGCPKCCLKRMKTSHFSTLKNE